MSAADRTIFFLFNLLQDVNIHRGLIYLAAREIEARIGFLVTEAFIKRDSLGIWRRELESIAADTGAGVHVFSDPATAYFILQEGRGGLILAASDSNLSAHKEASELFAIAPPGYLRITLQHGFECIGFLQSREHVLSHGRNISFGADLVCGWFDAPALTSLVASQRGKLVVTGPPTLLQAAERHPDHPPVDGGIICENMHSVRLQATGDHKASFMDTFFAFCAELAGQGRNVTLRPHPGGQYVLKNNIALPDNVHLNNLPIYNVDLKSYAYGISAPSTVVFDMVLAGIPVGVWRDPGGVMDAGNYDGLTPISTLEDWLAFERDVRLRPEMILERQRVFLDRLAMPTDPADVYRRFTRLFRAGLDCGGTYPVSGTATSTPPPPPKRILFIANALIPTLQLSFLKPLAPLFDGMPTDGGYPLAEPIRHAVLTADELSEKFGGEWFEAESQAWFLEQIRLFDPDLIICCRYSGPHSAAIADLAQESYIPLMYHVDDDLLNIPLEIGAAKYRAHNNPKRLDSVATLLSRADLTYCSTPALKQRLRDLNFFRPMAAGRIYCTSEVRRPVMPGSVRRIGYMGFDHAHDFEIVLPALERYLDRNPEVCFEIFGSIPLPETLKRFGDRVTEVAPVRDYQAFLQALADREWDIGICPLAQTPFNRVKANTKWVEYTASGMASLCSRGMVYDDCAGEGRGILVDDDGWEAALQRLTDDPDERFRIAKAAQTHLQQVYSDPQLRTQILETFALARSLQGRRRDRMELQT